MAAKSLKNSTKTATAGGRNSNVDLGWLQGLIGFNLRIAHEASSRVYLQSIARTAPHFAILTLINMNPGLTQVALARAVSRDSSSLTAILDDLCKRKLVSRTRPEHDRRSYELRITDTGRKAMEELRIKVSNHEEELNKLFTRQEKAALIAMLRKISASFS